MRIAWSWIRADRTALVAAGVIVCLVALAILAPLIAPYDPNTVDLDRAKLSPSRKHIFGTDEKGRDVFSRVIYGARVSLSIGLLAAASALVVGGLVGLVGGYFGGRIDGLLQMVTDITLAFPSLLLAIGITVILSPGFLTVLIALILVGWASIARLVRGEVIAAKEGEYVQAARACGSSPARVLFRHVLPNCLPIILVAGSLKVGTFILGEAALSFLDLGVRPPTPTWGFMISASREYLKAAPWMAIFPGLFLAGAVIAFNLLGDSVRDFLDPKLKAGGG